MERWSRLLRTCFIAVLVSAQMTACGGDPPGGAGSEVKVVNFVSTSTDQLVLAGQGGDETAVVTFLVTDGNGFAVMGESIDFSLSSAVGGARLLSSSATTAGDGTVSAIVQSGTVSTSVRVTATVSGTNVRAVSGDITMSSGLLVSGRMSLGIVLQSGTVEVDDNGTPDDSSDDFPIFIGGLDLGGVEAEVQVIANDRYGNPVLDGLRVSLWSPEFGLIASSCDLEGGICQASLISASPRPDDGIVSVIAYGSGAEEFTDANGNNQYDENEAWVDLPEAYLDENENSQYDPGEFFVDQNADGIYNAEGNGVWDGPCTNYCPGESSTIIWDTLTFRLVNSQP